MGDSFGSTRNAAQLIQRAVYKIPQRFKRLDAIDIFVGGFAFFSAGAFLFVNRTSSRDEAIRKKLTEDVVKQFLLFKANREHAFFQERIKRVLL